MDCLTRRADVEAYALPDQSLLLYEKNSGSALPVNECGAFIWKRRCILSLYRPSLVPSADESAVEAVLEADRTVGFRWRIAETAGTASHGRDMIDQ